MPKDQGDRWTPRRLALLSSLALAAVLLVASVLSLHPPRKLAALARGGDPFELTRATGAPNPDQIPGLPPGLRACTLAGGEGAPPQGVQSGWYARRHRAVVMVAGYPHKPGSEIGLEVRRANGRTVRLIYAGADPGQTWAPWFVELPPDGVAFRLEAEDGASDSQSWVGFSEPFKDDLRLASDSEGLRCLGAFVVEGMVLALVILALESSIRPWIDDQPWLLAIVSLAAVAAAGYAAFWIYLASPWAGRAFSVAILAGSLLRIGSNLRRKPPRADAECWKPLFLTALIGITYVGLTCLYSDGAFAHLAANRFVRGLPGDNQIPEIIANRLWSGLDPRHQLGDWTSSDRPPLQTGWLLLIRPLPAALGFDSAAASAAGGLWFQLLWVPAMWALLRGAGARRKESAAIVAAVCFTGVLLTNSVFTWPKLGGAALVLGAFLLCLNAGGNPVRFAAAGVGAALGWLAHGGVAFSFLGALPLVAFHLWRKKRMREWVFAAVAFAAVSLPWSLYQHFYDPPGNRLLKWHLAGAIDVDNRGFLQTLADSYGKLGWQGAWANRLANWRLQTAGDWKTLFHLGPRVVLLDTRWYQFDLTGYAFGWWILAALLIPIKIGSDLAKGRSLLLSLFLWLVLGWAAWLVLIFGANQAIIHQGTMVTQLIGFALLAWSALAVQRFIFVLLATLQIIVFCEGWIGWIGAGDRFVDPVALVAAALGGVCLLAVALGGPFAPDHETGRAKGAAPR